jgi:hypothetical protein
MMRCRTAAVVAAALLACPATAGAVSDIRITEHVVPATAATGQVVEAHVTVTNAGDTATESKTEIGWDATNDEGFGMSEFELGKAVCPPGSEDIERNLCLVDAPIGPGESVTAVFSGSSRFALALQARATQRLGHRHLRHGHEAAHHHRSDHPASARCAHHRLTLDSSRLRPGQRARLRYRLERRPKTAYAMLLQCVGKSGCRRTRFVLNSVVAAPRRRGRNTLRYPLPKTSRRAAIASRCGPRNRATASIRGR